jgi:hypothetical protein
MFSYVDLVRGEIAMEVGERFGVTIPDEETDRWRTLGDVARSVAERAGGTVTEANVFHWVRTLIIEGYGVTTELTPEGDAFGDYDRAIAWFMAPPYPHHLADRVFAKHREKRFGGPVEAGATDTDN